MHIPQNISSLLLFGLVGVFGIAISLQWFALPVAVAHGLALPVVIQIFSTDFRSYRIELSALIAFSLLGAAFIFLGEYFDVGNAKAATTILFRQLSIACAVGVGFVAIAKAYEFIRGRTGIATGDLILFAIAALWLPLANFPMFLLTATVPALLLVLVRTIYRGKKLKSESHVPFGGFQAVAIWITALLMIA